jgi:hypothetical protein
LEVNTLVAFLTKKMLLTPFPVCRHSLAYKKCK